MDTRVCQQFTDKATTDMTCAKLNAFIVLTFINVFTREGWAAFPLPNPLREERGSAGCGVSALSGLQVTWQIQQIVMYIL
ncbi:hypothetical protein ACNKHV_22635 [Shigella flexneri]